MRRGGAVSIALLFTAGCVSAPPPPAPPAYPASGPTAAWPPAPPPSIGVIEGQFALDRPAEQGGIVFGRLPPGTGGLTLDGKPVETAPDGRFLIGFGRDQAPVARLEALGPNGAILRQMIAVAARSWDIQSIPSLAKGTTPTPEFLARRKVELAQIRAARLVRSPVEGRWQRFIWPASGRISGVFGSQRIYAGEPGDFHAGVDIARPAGTPVVAPADGVVVLAAAAPFTLEGNLLIVDHGMGLNSAFLHLSRIDVRVGDHVTQGQPLGAIGMTGRATGAHLHWAMMWQGARIDPQRIAGPM